MGKVGQSFWLASGQICLPSSQQESDRRPSEAVFAESRLCKEIVGPRVGARAVNVDGHLRLHSEASKAKIVRELLLLLLKISQARLNLSFCASGQAGDRSLHSLPSHWVSLLLSFLGEVVALVWPSHSGSFVLESVAVVIGDHRRKVQTVAYQLLVGPRHEQV